VYDRWRFNSTPRQIAWLGLLTFRGWEIKRQLAIITDHFESLLWNWKSPITEGHQTVCVALQQYTCLEMSAAITGDELYPIDSYQDGPQYQNLRKQYEHAHTHKPHTLQLVASTWLGDYQGRPSTSLIRCVKESQPGASTNTLELKFNIFLNLTRFRL
jgi:hypothetical protein